MPDSVARLIDVPTVAAIIQAVAAEFEVTTADILSARRDRAASLARRTAMWLAVEITKATYTTIGHAFGKHDHSAVMAAVKRVEQRMKTDLVFAHRLEVLKAAIETKAVA